jgi:hypothetical protein
MTLIGETAPLEGAHQLLRTLKQRGHRLMLATTNRAPIHVGARHPANCRHVPHQAPSSQIRGE